jgi:SAM-dependent methyltransferase|tara:strand:+ start:3174 stop:4034 length:861 start_codon:yes stop_codon:yes gene_type:complete
MKKIDAFKYFNKDFSVREYSEIYKKLNLKATYPANVKREAIFVELLKKHKPKKIIDAGCGTGMPLIDIKKRGFNIIGYDKAKNMVIEAKENLKKNGFSTDLVFIDDFENPKKVKNNSFDCILGMGAFYYSKNVNRTILNQKKKLKKKGRLIFSLRNRLFDLVTLNNYTKKFLDEIYEVKYLNKEWKKKYENLTKNFSNRKKYRFKNIDEEGVYSHIPHNPITIKEEMAKLGLKVEGIYFYHFHALPPLFENFDELFYRKISWKIENPNDWRGHFLASAFIVDCKKI